MAINFPSGPFNYCIFVKKNTDQGYVDKVVYFSNASASPVTKFERKTLYAISNLSISIESSEFGGYDLTVVGYIDNRDYNLGARPRLNVKLGVDSSSVSSSFAVTDGFVFGGVSNGKRQFRYKDSTKYAQGYVECSSVLSGYTSPSAVSQQTSGWEVEETTTTTT